MTYIIYNMKDKREYYSRISKNFAFIAMALFLCLVLMEIAFVDNLVTAREHVLQTQLEERKRILNDTSMQILDSVYEFLITDELADYIDAPFGSPRYFKGQVNLQRLIQDNSPLFSNSRYMIGLSRKEKDAAIITANGCFPKRYFARELGLEDLDSLDGSSGIIVKSSDDGRIEDIVVVRERDTWFGDVLVYVYMPIAHLDSYEDDNIMISLYDMRTGDVYSPDMTIRNIDEEFLARDFSNEEILQYGQYSLISLKIPLSDAYIFLSSRDSVSITLWLTMIATLIVLAGLVYVISIKLKENLYKPVDEALSILSPEDESAGKIDEFGIIIDSCKKINTLHEELDKAVSAHNELKEQQKYRSFIRGVESELPTDDDRTSYFTLAYASVTEECEKPEQIFSKIDNVLKEIHHLHSIRVNRTHNAYIYKSEDESESYNVLYTTLQSLNFHLDGMDEVRFSIARTGRGYQTLPASFATAEELLLYRYRIKNRSILTEKDFPDEKDHVKYSLSDERMLVNAMVSDKDSALKLYDDVLLRNLGTDHKVNQKDASRFAFAMIGTVIRVFQEFKETPESLLGHSIDFEALYNDRNVERVLIAVRGILSEILTRRKIANTHEDDFMLNEMITYINNHYMENLMLIDLSNEFNLTPKYCSALFKKLSNDTFKNYLNQLRVEKACRKLEENPRMKIQDLSEEVGFLSSTTFIKAFSRIMGITPGTYAENIQKERLDKS